MPLFHRLYFILMLVDSSIVSCVIALYHFVAFNEERFFPDFFGLYKKPFTFRFVLLLLNVIINSMIYEPTVILEFLIIYINLLDQNLNLDGFHSVPRCRTATNTNMIDTRGKMSFTLQLNQV